MGIYKKRKKICLSVILAFSLLVCAGATDVLAANENDAANQIDVKSNIGYDDVIDDIHVIESSDIEESYDVENADRLVYSEENLASKQYLGLWDKYSSKFYYNQLSDEKKEIWDKIDALAYSYLAGSRVNDDFGTTTYSEGSTTHEAYVLGKIVCTSGGKKVFSSTDERNAFLYMYRCSNPQYYFISNGVIGSSDYQYIYPCVYKGFVDASDRKSATEFVSNKLESWVNEVGIPSSEGQKLAKAKAAHDKLCSNVVYNSEVVDGDGVISHEEDEAWYTQSMYSALALGKAVCVGYSETYDALCNALGIDSVSMTSTTHQWNEIRVNNSWYNVDTTWDDSASTIHYQYFLVSDADFENETNPKNRKAHTYSAFWDGYKGECTQNIGSTTTAAGTQLPTPLDKVETPRIEVKSSGSNYLVTLTDNTPGATIYYTTDGSDPAVAYAISSMCYSGTTLTLSDSNVKAIAVKDKYLDSDIGTASGGDDGAPMYRLYNPNSGEHFYTASSVEASNLDAIGWNYEGIAWYAPSEGDEVYRMYNSNAGDHHYTTNWAEAQSLVNAGWSYEGVAWYSGGSVKMLRAYNPNATVGTHHYTANVAEFNNLISIGWKDEGYAWSALKE